MKRYLAWCYKDLLAVRWLALSVAAITVIQAVVQRLAVSARPGSSAQQGADLLIITVVLGAFAIVERVIHLDPIAGDREEWFARPVSPLTLLGCKLGVIFFVVLGSRFLADVFTIAWSGADWGAVLLTLPLRYLLGACLWLLPAILLTALTRNVSQFLVTALVLIMVLIGLQTLLPSLLPVNFWNKELPIQYPWIPLWVLAVSSGLASLAILLWLYTSRRIAIAAIIVCLLSALIGSGLPSPSADSQWKLQRTLRADASVDRLASLQFDEERLLRPPEEATNVSPGRPTVRHLISQGRMPIALRVTGLGRDVELGSGQFDYLIRSVEGRRLGSGKGVLQSGLAASAWIPISLTSSSEFLNASEVQIDLKVRADLFRLVASDVKLHAGPNLLPGVGTCHVDTLSLSVSFCTSGRSTFPIAELRDGGRIYNRFGSPDDQSAVLPLMGWNPVQIEISGETSYPALLTLRSLRPLAPVEMRLSIPHYRIDAYSYRDSPGYASGRILY